MPTSWQTLLSQNLRQNRIAIVGVGNEFNGDDAAGVQLARILSRRECATDAGHILIIDAGPAPENITGALRSFHPEVVILVDAAQMDLPPGSIAWIPWDSTTGMSAASHMLPLSMLARYLTLEFGCTVHLLGIQPAHNELDAPLSVPVQGAVEEIARVLCRNLFRVMAV